MIPHQDESESDCDCHDLFHFFEQSYVASSGLYADYKKDSQDFSFFYNDVIFFIIYLMNTSNAYGYGKENMCTDYGAE